MTVRPRCVGRKDAIAGRSTPGSIFRTNLEIAISAPVFPALTAQSASPDFTRSIATRIDESRLLRNAVAGGSCISTTSLAARMDIRGLDD